MLTFVLIAGMNLNLAMITGYKPHDRTCQVYMMGEENAWWVKDEGCAQLEAAIKKYNEGKK